jgi:hypothetical protein
VRIRDVVAEGVSAAIELDHGTVTASDLRADLLGGKHRGDLRADFTSAIPVYSGSGTLTGISLGQLADAMHDAWISGTGSGSYQIKATGKTAPELWQSAEGSLHFDLRDGTLPHVALTSDSGPLQIGRWQGSALLQNGTIEIEKSSLLSSAAAYEVSGTASLGQELDFKVSAEAKSTAGALVYAITGTVAEPRVAVIPAAETQAQLAR